MTTFATRAAALPSIKLHIVRETPKGYKPTKITTPTDVERYLGWMRHEAEEIFVVLHLDAKNRVTSMQEISRGTLSASLVHPREVFKGALINNTYAIIIAHNHPTGETTASPEDVKTTEQLLKVADIIGVPIIDHIIIGDEDASYSFRENRPNMWA